MTRSKGASVSDQALVASDQAASRLAPTGFDPSRIEEIANLIEAASVPHESGIAGAGRRTLRYYASCGIDYFDHPHERCRALFEDAARLVLTLLESERTGA